MTTELIVDNEVAHEVVRAMADAQKTDQVIEWPYVAAALAKYVLELEERLARVESRRDPFQRFA